MCQHHMDVDPSMCGGSVLVHAAMERLSHILHMLSVITIIKIAKFRMVAKRHPKIDAISASIIDRSLNQNEPKTN